MILKCEICGKRISKEVFSSRVRDDGKEKNKGECSDCAKDLEKWLENILKEKS